MHVLILVMALIAGLSCEQFSARREGPADFQTYVAQVQKLGMTESAQGDLSMVANIRTGGTLLTFVKDDLTGTYERSYMGTACPVPGANLERVKEWQTELQKRVERDMPILRQLADRDASGFVSTAEGREFRELFEFGYLAAQIVKSEAAPTSVLARSGRVAEHEVAARVAEYNRLANRLNQSSEFTVPVVELTGLEARAAGSG
ncbi:MAG TPA: hypothetical protein VGV60_00890 [Candidatus Polarisedimenticolia bacterium]|nr:hypothetical protein [Candidatus Polarisedimenticolia bacterium]